MHDERMARRHYQRKSDYAPDRLFPRTKSDDPAYRKSIWPEAKIARRIRACKPVKREVGA